MVEQIAQIAGPHTMDALTWPAVYAGCWPHTYGAELLLHGFHDLTGLTWMATIPLTAVLVRTVTLPAFVSMQRTSHFMALMKPKLEELQAQMTRSLEKGNSVKESTVRIAFLVGFFFIFYFGGLLFG